ncbi:DEAD/DEAH box helicase family protein [Candidatus Peregrinibacteria bacterium]|nr:DEAD/DEAH box helicase family protein [Candidatus Peregrinibacteria bacterium]
MESPETLPFDIRSPEELQIHIPRMVRNGLSGVLSKTRNRFRVIDEIVEDISSQILIDILSDSIRTLEQIRTHIKTLCFQELDYITHNLSGQDFFNGDGDERVFEGPREGVDDLRSLEDVCDGENGAGMRFHPDVALEVRYAEEDRRNQKIKDQYVYFAQELAGIYKSLKSDFLKRFFMEWLVVGRNPRELSQIIRIPHDDQEHISLRRVSQCRSLIINHVASMCGLDAQQINPLLSCAPVIFAKLAESDEKKVTEVFGDIEKECDGFQKFSRIDTAQILNASQQAKRVLYVEDFFPELLPAYEAKRKQIEAIIRLEAGLESFIKNPETLCRGEPQPLHPHQRKKMEHIVASLVSLMKSDKPIFLADIAPPGAGKTYVQAVLAKLTGLPFVFVTSSNAILEGPDGALPTFEKLFPRNELGLVNSRNKEFGRTSTLTTYQSLTIERTLRDILMQSKGQIPLLFLLDEGDLAQSDLRKSAVRAIQHALHYPIICAFSATTTVEGKHLGEMADIVDEMGLVELIKLKKAKHVLGFYVDVKITIDKTNIVKINDEQTADYKTFDEQEQETFIASPLQVVQENHPGEQGIIHCMSVRHAEQVAERLAGNDINAVCISGKSPGEQKVMIQRYIDGEINILTSCDYLARGFSDYGVTQYVIFADLTSSVTNLYHKVGRGFRPHPKNKVLSIYQILPTDIRVPNFIPALLSDIFPIDNAVPIGSTASVNDMRKRLIELIERGEIEFIGAIGAKPAGESDIHYVTQIEVKKVIDTLEAMQDNNLELNRRNIAELFRPIVDAFMQSLGGDITCINTGRKFVGQEVTVAGKKIKGERFLRNIICLVGGISPDQTWKYLSCGIALIKEWYASGREPDAEFIDQTVNKANEKRAMSLKLDATNIDALFRPIMDEIIRVAEKEAGDVDWLTWRGLLGLPEIEINGQTTSACRFFYTTLAILLDMTQTEIFGHKQLGVELVKEWYKTGQRPNKVSVAHRLQREQTERASQLDIMENNIDQYFPLVMDAFCEAAGEEKGAWDWIRIHKIQKVEVNVDGKSINGLRFVTNVCAILCGISAGAAQKIQGASIQIVREWYRTGRRPSKEWCLAQKHEGEEKTAGRLKITEENIDDLFFTVMDGLISVGGHPKGDCDWMNYIALQGVEVMTNGRSINGQTFTNQVFTILTDLPYKDASKFRGMTGELMKRWYKTRKRPDKTTIDAMLHAPSRTRYMRKQRTAEIEKVE